MRAQYSLASPRMPSRIASSLREQRRGLAPRGPLQNDARRLVGQRAEYPVVEALEVLADFGLLPLILLSPPGLLNLFDLWNPACWPGVERIADAALPSGGVGGPEGEDAADLIQDQKAKTLQT